MAKRDRKPAVQSDQSFSSNTKATETTTTLSAIRRDANLRYQIQVLLYDISNVALNPSSEKRISSTTHELYISTPYFTDSEAVRIRTALIDDALEEIEGLGREAQKEDITVEEAIHKCLSGFFDKRKAGGDARPCGPHDMIPIYTNIFGISKDELKSERFLNRLRRSGVGDARNNESTTLKGKGKGTDENDGKSKKNGKGKNEGKRKNEGKNENDSKG